MEILAADRIQLQAKAEGKNEAIRRAGELLVNSGCVTPAYIDGMLAREQTMSTYLDNGVAIPHGKNENRKDILKTGISILQIPDGVEWEPGEKAYLIVGIAASSDEHIDVLTALSEVVEDQEAVTRLRNTNDIDLILSSLGSPGNQD